jgi:hypothetical protein
MVLPVAPQEKFSLGWTPPRTRYWGGTKRIPYGSTTVDREAPGRARRQDARRLISSDTWEFSHRSRLSLMERRQRAAEKE